MKASLTCNEEGVYLDSISPWYLLIHILIFKFLHSTFQTKK